MNPSAYLDMLSQKLEGSVSSTRPLLAPAFLLFAPAMPYRATWTTQALEC